MTRIAVGPRELDRPGRRLDVGESHDPPLDLRHRLLCDHHDVAVLQAARALGCLVQRQREIVARAQLGDALERHHADAVAAQGRPVTRTPACAL